MADTRNSFWSRRSERHKAGLEAMEELALERREMMEFLQQRVEQRRLFAEGSSGAGSAHAIASRYLPAMSGSAAGLLGSGSYL
ncbi:MAG: hypothetical protein LUE17_14230 [Planctomycetaceae bacterium]|nr:hypothetical protein [Planctomycetaceae bacterium]